jgi:hypothetical protein
VEYSAHVVALPAAARKDRDIGIDVYDDPRAAAAAGWDGLVQAHQAPVFYRCEYLTAYYDSPLGFIDKFAYIVLHGSGGGQPVAVLPVALYTRPDPIGGLRLLHPGIEREPALLSHVWHCYDTRLVGPTEDDRVMSAMLSAMGSLAASWRASWYGLINVERDTPTAAALAAAGWAGRHLVDRFSADLTGVRDLDGYLARLGPRARANLRRNARRAADAGYTVATVAVADADLAEIARLCDRTATRFANSGFYPVDTFARFVAALGPSVHILEIRQSGRLVAVGVCLTDEQRFHTWTCGVDYEVAGNASPYAVLFAESVALGLRLGRRTLEGGRSNETFKRRHGLAARPLDAYVRRA